LDFLVLKRLFFLLFSVSMLHGELDTNNDAKKVKIKGEALTAHQVLEQVQSQLDLKIQLDVPDTYGFKQVYDHHVTVEQVIQAVVEYYRDFNQVNLELLKRGKHRIILREQMDQKPDPVPAVESAKKRVESETQPNELNRVMELEDPVSLKKDEESEKTHKVSDPVISKLKFEVSDLVSLQSAQVEPGEMPKKVMAPKRTNEKVSSQTRLPRLIDLELPGQNPKDNKVQSDSAPSRVLKIELVGDKLIDLDDEVLDKKPQTKTSERSLQDRLETTEAKKKPFMSDWKARLTSEWSSSPAVEQGYYGAYSPWQKPSILSYRPVESARGQLKVSFGTATSEEISQPFDGIDVRSEKLLLTYDKGLGEELKAHIRGGLLNHDGELSVAGVVYNFESTGLTDLVVGLNYMPQTWTEYGNLSFGLDLTLPTGDDSDFAGSGGLGFVTSAGYHVSFGRWRAQTQINFSFLNEYETYTLNSESTMLSYDLGCSYYINELYDVGFHVHWAESPWETAQGIWGEDAFSLQMVVQTLAWTDPVSFYVDLGLSGAAPEFGVGLQWLREFQ
jgi:hypothetical protein